MTIPDQEWKSLKARGMDIVWLMGVWKRSPDGREKALNNPELSSTYGHALPGWRPEDVTGSPYAVYDYRLEPALGEAEELVALRKKLNRLGLQLMVDFVPNHLAMDHPWTVSYPDRFVGVDASRVPEHPDWFFKNSQGVYLAHGRDPYFPPWGDTAQVNFFSREMREAMTDELIRISEAVDGVRCDMAMLGLNRIFQQVWGNFVKDSAPQDEFWKSAITQVKKKRKSFLFLAEVYWNLEWELQQMGFDYTYDKTLYDRLRHSDAAHALGHLKAEHDYQSRCARFIENHDEERAAQAFGKERSIAAASAAFTLPGLRFFHEGQAEGLKIKIPIQLIRAVEENPDSQVANFYSHFLQIIDAPAFHEGLWQLWESSAADVMAWSWSLGAQTQLVVLHFGEGDVQGEVWVGGTDAKISIALKPWECRFMEIDK